MKKNNTYEQGFTLIEVIIAIVLLLIAILGTAAVTSTIINGNAFSKRVTTATTLAQYKIEDLKNTAYASLSSGSDTQDTIYTRTWTVTTDSPASGMKSIDVTVSFSWKSNTHNITLKTIVANL